MVAGQEVEPSSADPPQGLVDSDRAWLYPTGVAYGPFPPYGSNRQYRGVGGLINQLHGAMLDEPRAEHVSQYAKMLASLTGLQAKEHAQPRPPGGPGGPVAEPVADTGESSAIASAEMAARYAPQQFDPIQALLHRLATGATGTLPGGSRILQALRGPGMGGPVGY